MIETGLKDRVANVVIFLSSEQAGWITGQKFFVGGGHGV
jgi:NAD(P)-dependent dehydrogenase (short-subunit alcohol dehydrogenase family)